MRRLGVHDVPRPDAARWQEMRPILAKSCAGYGALAFFETWLNAWATTRRMHDARPLLCPFVCIGPEGGPVADDMSHCLKCDSLWSAAARAAGGGPGGRAVERLALGEALGWDATVGAIARLVCSFGIYHAVKIPCGGASAGCGTRRASRGCEPDTHAGARARSGGKAACAV